MNDLPFLGSSGFVEKSEVKYEPSSNAKNCADCLYFIEEAEGLADACATVSGPVEADHVCMLWSAK
jgi:hypothetical protein